MLCAFLCQIRESILSALRREGEKAEIQWLWVLQNEAKSWRKGGLKKSQYYSILVFSI